MKPDLSVKGKLIWADSDTLINLELVEYIKFGKNEVRLSFCNGEPLLLKGEAAQNLRQFLAAEGFREAYKPVPKVGYGRAVAG